MLAFDHGALFRAVIQNALHSISIESDDSVNGAERVPIAFAARYAVSLYHIAYPCSPFTVVRRSLRPCLSQRIGITSVATNAC